MNSVHLVEDLRKLSSGSPVTVDRNKTPIRLPKPDRTGNQQAKDQYGIAAAVAGIAAEKNAQDREQTDRDVQVLNHCLYVLFGLVAFWKNGLCQLNHLVILHSVLTHIK